MRGKDKEIGNLLKEIHDIDEAKKIDRSKEVLLKHHLFLKEKELEKAKRLMRMFASNASIDRYFETVEKETKYNLQLFANYENANKKMELEQMLKTLEG